MNPNPMPPSVPGTPAGGARPAVSRRDQLETRLAARLAEGLSLRAEELPHDIQERLRVARAAAARQARQRAPAAAPAAAVVLGGAGALAGALAGGPRWWQRVLAAAPVAGLVAGLLLIDHHGAVERVAAVADIDLQLLADDLPPAAYSDPGFAEYLRRSPP